MPKLGTAEPLETAVLAAVDEYVEAVDDDLGHVADQVRDAVVERIADALGVPSWTAEDLFEHLVTERDAGRL